MIDLDENIFHTHEWDTNAGIIVFIKGFKKHRVGGIRMLEIMEDLNRN